MRPLLCLFLTLALLVPQLASPPAAWALYVLGYGDSVSVVVKDAPQYSVNATLRPDGVITIPFVGDVEVGGLTPSQAASRIASALRTVLREPLVTVGVTAYKYPIVTFLGEVKAPGVKTLSRLNPTVFDALAEAGGFTDRAVPAEVLIIRGDGPNAEHIVVDVETMMKTGDFSNNVAVRSGDKIQVKEVWWPDWAEIRQDLAIFVGLIGTIASILALYDRASRTE